MDYEYLQFCIHDSSRFQQFVALFERLKQDKEMGKIDDPSAYLTYFDEPARNFFWWPTEEESQDWLKKWYATPLEKRWSDPVLTTPWHFDSMIEALRDGDYKLIACNMVTSTMARLEFSAFAYPYGGTDSMQALIQSFGFTVTEINDGSGPPFAP